MESEQADQVNISLSNDEAVVLFELLARFNNAEQDFADQAEQRVLWDLEAMLESSLREPLLPDHADRLAAAREKVRDSTD